ncbi:putative galacturonosyltransferase 9 [Carex littledalei]|uniref:Hexosyltransferase n=1 Tax=Carex littledalei TaxID=544730 RepID=A0A833VJR5_9POAL|nr:putative galacturonosyltransferase 9 [Carex littledalei]
MAGGRPIRPMNGVRSFFTDRIFLSFVATLLFLVAISFLLSTKATTRSQPIIQSLHLDLIRRQASDHAALVSAYAAYSRRLKIDASRQVRLFSNLASSLSELASRVGSDEDSLHPVEKEAKDRVKLARQLVSESKEAFDTQVKIQKLRDTIFSVHEQLHRARKLGDLSSQIAASSTPKSLHCLAMRLMEHRILHPEDALPSTSASIASDPSLYHYAIFSENIIAVSVVVNSVIRNAADPSHHVFHVVTDPMYLPAMQVWFAKRPPTGGAHVDLHSTAEYTFLDASYSPVIRQMETGKQELSLLNYLRFYLPEIFPKLKKIILLEDDVVVQKDLADLWMVDLQGNVNGAVEMCFGGFRRYNRYLNFTNQVVKEKFSPRACAWAYGVNVFDLQAWRTERCTEQFHQYQEMNEDGSLWRPGTVLPAGLMTFYTTTKPLEKSWHVMGLGYNPSVSPEEIRKAAVLHFNGNMKPWLDVAMNQYKQLWTKYVDSDMEFLQLCNFGL